MAYFDLQVFAADGHLFFDTVLDVLGFSNGINKLGSIAKTGLKTLAAGVGAVTGAMGAGIVAGMKYNADMQNYMANFETMLGSAEAATDHVNQLKEFAAKTPFEMSDLANASKTLLAFGTDADSVMPIMQQLGDISLGNKDKFNSLALVYGQVSSQGKLMGQDLLQMINAGFNPLQEISKHTGESMADLKDKMSKGQIGVEELNQALQWATEEGGQFSGGMEKASETMDGLISTLKDNAMSLLGEVVQPISDEMTNTLLPAAIDAMDQLSAAFQEDGMEGLIDAGADILANLVTGFVEALPSVIETALTFITTFVDALNENMPQLIEAAGLLITAIGEGLLQLAPSLLSLGESIVSNIILGITGNSGETTTAGEAILNGLIEFLSTGLPQMLQTGAELTSQLVSGILGKVPDAISSAGTIISQLITALMAGLPKMLESGVQLILSLVSGITGNLPSIAAAAVDVIGQLIVTIAENLPQMLQSGLELTGQLAAGLIQAIPDIISAAVEITTNIWDKIKEIDWLGLGADIISGIAKGLLNGLGTIAEAAKSVAKGALDAAKNFLGIHSPSRVFQDEVGKQIAVGLGDGIRNNKDYAQKSAEEISQAVLDAAKKKLDNYKVYNKLTLADEVAYWNEVRKQTNEGTQARIDADKEYLTAKEDLNDQLLTAEEDYSQKVAAAYQNLNDKIQDLNQEYRDAVDSRTDEIRNAFGLFDEADMSTDLTSGQLIHNLQSQVDALHSWQNNLNILEGRGIGSQLMEELQDLGPQAAAEIQILTDMTDDELEQYVSLFKQKNQIARAQAVEELEPMKQDIVRQIDDLRDETSRELAEYQQEYLDAMQELGAAINKPAEDIKLAMAQNAVQMVAGLASSIEEETEKPENTEKFKAIADNILKATDDLPSEMLLVGQTAIDSMIQGIKERSSALYQAMTEVVSTAVTQAVSAAISEETIQAVIDGTDSDVASVSLPAHVYGNEGFGPGYSMDYARIGQEMASALDGVNVTMDKQKVGSIVSEPVNDTLGSQARREGRDII